MKVAITYDNGKVFQHFGHTEHFKIYEIENKKIIKEELINTNGSGHGLLGELLISKGVNTLICGGLGSGAKNILEENNIKVYPGVIGKVDIIINEFIEGNLKYDLDKKCEHHNHKHEHDCKNHDCSSDKEGCLGNK